MSTQKWSDDDLDDFFRKSAEESDPPYDPTAWQDLKARLNDRDRTRLLKWTLPLLLLLGLTGGLSWYTYKPASPQKSLSTLRPSSATATATQPGQAPGTKRTVPPDPTVATGNRAVASSETQPAEPRPIGRPQSAGPASRVATKPGNQEKPADLSTGGPLANQQPAGPEETHRSANRPADSPTATGYNAPLPSTAPGLVFSPEAMHTTRQTTRIRARQLAGKDPKQVRLRAGMGQPDLLTRRSVGPPDDTARQNAKTGGLGRHRSVMSGPDNTPVESAGGEPGPDAQVLNRFLWPTPALLTARAAHRSTPLVATPEPVWENSTGPMQRPARFRLSGLSIQAVLAPDLTTIGLHNFDRPGSNLGVMIQYQVSNRFSLQTGALWSTKVYTSLPSEYVWPVTGGMTVWPASITGRCTMFDIPLNLRYDVVLRPGGAGRGPRRWFVSGGVTSYFIKRENYNYNYAWPDDPAIKYRSWAVNKGSSFGLSNLNISLGYERPVSRRLSWQIEPFMKIPLQPIGYFKVRLVSTGAFISLRYRL